MLSEHSGNDETFITFAETRSEVWGDEVGASVPQFFCRPLQNVKFGGGGRRGLTVFVNFNI